MKRRVPVVTCIIGILCVIVYAVQAATGQADTVNGMILFGGYYKPFIIAGEYWRFLTVGFVHANVWHLLINMMSLYALGISLEFSMKRWKYLVILLGSVTGSSIFLFITQGNVLAVGLSGGLYGLMMTYFILIYRAGGLKIPRVRNVLLSTLVMNLLINFMPGVSWMAHLGGTITGFLLSEILIKSPDQKVKQKDYIIASAALVVCMGWMMTRSSTIPQEQMYILTDYQVLTEEKKYLPQSYIEHLAEKLDNIYNSGTILQDAVSDKEA